MSYDAPADVLRAAVALALQEDIGEAGDVTSIACVPESAVGRAAFVARDDGTLAGSAAVAECARQVDATLRVEWIVPDGTPVQSGTTLGSMSGRLRSILAVERTALNFLTHCSGVASLTRAFVDAAAAAGSRSAIRDTRKTLPGLRALEKAAVRAGGGCNHRESLSDAVLIKDNHLSATRIVDAVGAARMAWPDRIVEVECDTLAQVREALRVAPDQILLDNMTPIEVGEAVKLGDGVVAFEVSGGVSIDTVAEYAATGVDFIAVGALTHSAPALDIGLDIEPTRGD